MYEQCPSRHIVPQYFFRGHKNYKSSSIEQSVMQQKAQVFQIEIFAHHLVTRRFDKNSARVAVCVKFSHDGMQGAFDKTRKGKRR